MKAILVIDLKDGLVLEKLGEAEIRIDRYDTYKTIKRKAKLKPLPKREEIYEKFYQWYHLGNDERYQSLRQLVDDCLDEILGEEK